MTYQCYATRRNDDGYDHTFKIRREEQSLTQISWSYLQLAGKINFTTTSLLYYCEFVTLRLAKRLLVIKTAQTERADELSNSDF